MVPIPTEEEKRWIEKEREKQRLSNRRHELLNHSDTPANVVGYILSGLFLLFFLAWAYNYDPNEPKKRCVAYPNDGGLNCLRYEGENVSNGTIDPSDACVKRVKYSDGTYVDYGIHPDEYCPED